MFGKIKELWRPWYVVVERANMAYDERLAPYAVGPYKKEIAIEEMNSDCSLVYCLLTIDAKAERYIADECYMAQTLSSNAILIVPSEVDGSPKMRGENKALYERRS